VLWDHGVKHEYRSVRGADHLGRSLEGRFLDAFRFVGSALAPPPPDDTLQPFRAAISSLRKSAGLSES